MSADPGALPRVDPEVERSRESAARLLDAFRRKLRPVPPVRHAAAGLERLARRQPAAALTIALAAGFLVGHALGGRFMAARSTRSGRH